MDLSPITKLYELIRELKVVSHKSRQHFICRLVEGLIKSRSVHFSQIADKIESEIKEESKERRIQDFFQKVDFDYAGFAKLFMSFVHHDRLVLSIDRTEWDYGKVQINILCITVSIGKMAVPVYFEALDNNSGNSHTEDRCRVLEKIIETVGVERIGLLIMDREFIGQKWLKRLKSDDINFCVRVPKHHSVTLSDGTCTTAQELFDGKQTLLLTDVVVDKTVVNLSLSRGNDGEMLYLIGTIPSKDLRKTYAKRWTIEVFFQALKKRGFDMEASCLRDIKKYRKLFTVVSLAYTICWATGIQDGKSNPVKPKKHGYPQYSVFRRGLNLMRKFYKNKVVEPLMTAIQLAANRIDNKLKTVG